MKRLILAVLAILMCASPATAQQFPKNTLVAVHVTNHSDSCAWVTIYWGRVYSKWEIENSPEGRPRFVDAKQTGVFYVRFTNPTPIPLPAEIKVRAEFKRGNCNGPTIADHEAYNKSILADKSVIIETETIKSLLSGPPYSVSTPQ